MRTAKVEVQLSTIFIDNATGNVLLFASHVMITCLMIASGESSARGLTDVHRSFAIDAQSFDAAVVTFAVLGMDVVEDRVGFGEFFLGIAFTTGFNR